VLSCAVRAAQAAALEGLAGLNQRTLATLGSWVRSRYQAECSAALALDKVRLLFTGPQAFCQNWQGGS
jgi:hypothetical protein